MKSRINVNTHIIRANRKNGTNDPPLIVRTYKGLEYGHELVITHGGVEVARVVYRPESPLNCGAECWVETDNPVQVIRREDQDGYRPGKEGVGRGAGRGRAPRHRSR